MGHCGYSHSLQLWVFILVLVKFSWVKGRIVPLGSGLSGQLLFQYVPVEHQNIKVRADLTALNKSQTATVPVIFLSLYFSPTLCKTLDFL